MNMKRSFASFSILAAVLAFTAGSAFALTPAEIKAGRTLVKTQASTIVELEMVVTMQMTVNGRTLPPRERKIDVSGTVVDPSGLVVTSLAGIDPKVAFEAVRSALTGAAAQSEVGETDYKEVKVRMANGTEYPARVVLKDVDLGLAFVALEKTAEGEKREFPAVKLEPSAKGELLESYISVSRAAKNHQRAPMVRPIYVSCIVTKPRCVYLAADITSGCPIFDLEGKLLGISIQQVQGGRVGGLVVIPAADIAEIAKQAQAALAAPVPVQAPTPSAPAEAGATGQTNPEAK